MTGSDDDGQEGNKKGDGATPSAKNTTNGSTQQDKEQPNADRLLKKKGGPRKEVEQRGLEVVTEHMNDGHTLAKERGTALKVQRWITLIALLLVPFTYVISHESGKIIGVDSEGRTVRLYELTERAISDAAVARFCTESVSEIGTFGFHDFRMRFAQAKGRFTVSGWRAYNEALVTNQIPSSIQAYTQTYATVPTGPCEIYEQGPHNGRYWWRVRVKVLRTVTSGTKEESRPLTIELYIARVGIAEAKELIAIELWRDNP